MTVNFADVKPSILNVVTVTLMAVVGISAGKYLFNRFNVPGLKDLFASI